MSDTASNASSGDTQLQVRLVTYLKQLARPAVTAGEPGAAPTARAGLQIASDFYTALNDFAQVVGLRVAEGAVYVATQIRGRQTVNEECVFHALALSFPGPFGASVADRARHAVETFRSEESKQHKTQARKAQLTLPPPRFRTFFEDSVGAGSFDGRVLVGKLAPVAVAASVEQITQEILVAAVHATRASEARRVSVRVLHEVLRTHPDLGPIAAMAARTLTVGAGPGAAALSWWTSE